MIEHSNLPQAKRLISMTLKGRFLFVCITLAVILCDLDKRWYHAHTSGINWIEWEAVNMLKESYPQSAHNRLMLITLLSTLVLLQGCQAAPTAERDDIQRTGNRLIIPEILEDVNPDPDTADFELFVQQGETEFFPGLTTETLGYNGNYLGPILRIRRGQDVNVKVHNQLGEPTTVHWHGMDVSGEADGGPHQPIMPGDVWEPGFTIDQPAATLWYHPHIHGTTGPQVYRGLAGLIYIEDGVSDNLNLPKDYGVNDIPLILQDRNFNSDGSFSYQVNMMGLVPGDTMLINGTVDPYVEVNLEKVRLRILNGSNFENFHLQLNDGSPFYQIASDGGFLERPVVRESLFMAPGERVEVIVDFSSATDKNVSLMAGGQPVLQFFALDTEGADTEIPESLTVVPEIPESDQTKTRVFELRSMGLQGTINGKSFSMNRIDEEVNLNETEIWIIRNFRSMMHASGHPFHVHGTQFQVVSRNGNLPPPEERGFKDTIHVDAGEEVVIKVRFNHTGLYMYHCHMLEHEDYGMMGQFMVQ